MQHHALGSQYDFAHSGCVTYGLCDTDEVSRRYFCWSMAWQARCFLRRPRPLWSRCL